VVCGAVGGVTAGAVFAAVTMWFTSSQGMGATTPLQMIAAMVQGQAALEGGTASPLVGAVVHMVLSAGFGAAFGLDAARLTDPLVAVAGLVFGALLRVVNFLVVAPLLFPWMQNANQPRPERRAAARGVARRRPGGRNAQRPPVQTRTP
jgi:large-conductance mechanosensitive channel